MRLLKLRFADTDIINRNQGKGRRGIGKKKKGKGEGPTTLGASAGTPTPGFSSLLLEQGRGLAARYPGGGKALHRGRKRKKGKGKNVADTRVHASLGSLPTLNSTR